MSSSVPPSKTRMNLRSASKNSNVRSKTPLLNLSPGVTNENYVQITSDMSNTVAPVPPSTQLCNSQFFLDSITKNSPTVRLDRMHLPLGAKSIKIKELSEKILGCPAMPLSSQRQNISNVKLKDPLLSTSPAVTNRNCVQVTSDMSNTVTPVSPSTHMCNSQFFLDSITKNSPTVRLDRMHLPLGAKSIKIKELSGKILGCPAMPLSSQRQNFSNVKLKAPLLSKSPAGTNRNCVQVTSDMPGTVVPIPPKQLPNSNSRFSLPSISKASLGGTHKNTKQISNVQSVLKNMSLTESSECQHTSLSNASIEDPKKNLDTSALIHYSCLKLVLPRLNVCDLLKATEVCAGWKYMGQRSYLWMKVSFQGIRITNWEKCCQYLQKRGTMHLNLHGIVHPSIQPWLNLEKNVPLLNRIEELFVEILPPSLLQVIILHMPLLRTLECSLATTACTSPRKWETSCELELKPFQCLNRLERLKINSAGGIVLGSGSNFVMPYLPKLRHVALTGFDFHSHVNLEFLFHLNDLISLELGNISSIEPGVYPLLGTLTKLKSLRLETGGSIDGVKFSEALSKMESLELLELMNFKISSKLARSFNNLNRLIHVNIYPDTTTEGAVINQNLFTAMSKLKNLKYVCWGIIFEGDTPPHVLQLRKEFSSEDKTTELKLEDFYKTLLQMFPGSDVELRCVHRKFWKQFCYVRE